MTATEQGEFMKRIKLILAAGLIVAFAASGINYLVSQNQELRLKEVQLQDTASELKTLQLKYEKLNTDLDKELQAKQQDQERIKQLEAEKQQLDQQKQELERRLQAKLEAQKLASQRLNNAVNTAIGSGTGMPYGGNLAKWLSDLRGCESGGNYSINTGNGYFGAYQFLPSTWNSTAKRMGQMQWYGVLPNHAPPATQDAFVINNTNASKGGLASQHPGCYYKLGLSQFPPAN